MKNKRGISTQILIKSEWNLLIGSWQLTYMPQKHCQGFSSVHYKKNFNLWGKYSDFWDHFVASMQFQKFCSFYCLAVAALFFSAVLLAGSPCQSMSWERCQVTRVCCLFDRNVYLSHWGIWHWQFFANNCYLKHPLSIVPPVCNGEVLEIQPQCSISVKNGALLW